MSKKPYSFQERFYTVLITALSLSAVVLVLAIVVQSKLNARLDRAVQTATGGELSTAEPLKLVVQHTAANVTPTPKPVITPMPTPVPTASPEPFEYLPVYTRGRTEEKIIAMTLDDCSNLTALRRAAEAAQSMNAKLTLFPIGNTLMTTKMTEAMRVCVLQLGFQVENRTQNNNNLYRLPDEDMAREILTPDISLDYALNKEYGMHLLRPRGAQGTRDPRTNAYLKQLGYDGFVTWTFSGTEATADALKESLAPGYIYTFNCTESAVEKMIGFMQYAQDNGYRMVTVNEVLGFAENACADPTEDILSRQFPMPEPYRPMSLVFQSGDRAWQVLLIQRRLAELGYLTPDDADGVFGDGTAQAIQAMQSKLAQPCTGVATIEFQSILFSADAPAAGE